ncbi:MAG: insulinase family protein [Chloroflexi bacterium]|nr:insulinase family protein [Chloroflexota bacterium]
MSSFEKVVLENGLRIVTSTLPHTRSVSICIFVGAGSRYESDEIAGVSHFLEHMLFKGTKRRPSAREISEEIEGIGGIMNAGTDKELTVYWAKVGDHRFKATLDILADSLRHSLLDPAELEKERGVILEELAMTEDSPGEMVSLLVDEVVWPNQPLGRDVGGTPASVKRVTREDVVRYMEHLYAPQNTVVAVAGNVSHDEIVAEVSRHLADWEPSPVGTWYAADIPGETPRLRLRAKKTEQTHLCLALPGLSMAHPDRYPLDVLNAVLGEGMSSRLFLELREQRSLCYDVSSYVNHYLDSGSVVIAAGVDPRNVDETVRALREEVAKMREPVPERELSKAKEFIKGRLQLRMEDTRTVASWMGAQELLRHEILTVDDVLNIVDSVTAEEVQRVAITLLRPELFRLAVVGPYRSETRFAKLLAA